MTAAARLRVVLLVTFGVALVGSRAANAFTISGLVTAYFASGPVVAGTQVTVTECTDGLQIASTTSDMAGFYSLGVPAGTYDLTVAPPVALSYASFTYRGLSVTADQTLNLELPPHGDPPSYVPMIDNISALAISPAMLVAASEGPSAVSAGSCKTGAIISYSGSRPATTTFTVQRPHAGRRSGRNCVRLTQRTTNCASCRLYIEVGSFTHADDAIGTNHFRFTGRINGRKLPPGPYRLRAVPRNALGNGPAVYESFHVTK
jgi:hypothetical protein